MQQGEIIEVLGVTSAHKGDGAGILDLSSHSALPWLSSLAIPCGKDQ